MPYIPDKQIRKLLRVLQELKDDEGVIRDKKDVIQQKANIKTEYDLYLMLDSLSKQGFLRDFAADINYRNIYSVWRA